MRAVSRIEVQFAAPRRAIKACRILEVDEPAPRMRRLAPYGLLTGLRRYLLARTEDDPTGPVRWRYWYRYLCASGSASISAH